MRDSFIFYRSFYEASKALNTKQQAELFRAICEYSLDKKEIKLSKTASAFFTLIKPQLTANYKRYENGKKTKKPREPKEAKHKQTGSKTEANKNVNVNKNVFNENENGNENGNDGIQNLWIRSFGRNPNVLEIEETLKLIEKFGKEKAFGIMKEGVRNNFRSIFSLTKSLNNKGKIMPKQDPGAKRHAYSG